MVEEDKKPSTIARGNNAAQPVSGAPSLTSALPGLARRTMGWINTLRFPPLLSLTASVLVAFLVFPACRGFVMVRKYSYLENQKNELEQALMVEKTRSDSLARDLSLRVGLSSSDTLAERARWMTGISISPLLDIENRQGRQTDLVRIDFSQSDRAVLAFRPSKAHRSSLDFRLFHDEAMIWSQTVPILPNNPENLIVLTIAKAMLAAGSYRLEILDNQDKRASRLAQYDLSIAF